MGFQSWENESSNCGKALIEHHFEELKTRWRPNRLTNLFCFLTFQRWNSLQAENDDNQRPRDETMIELSIPEMSCGHCKASIEKAISAADASSKVEVDLENRTVKIDSNLEQSALLAAVEKAGYEATVI